jgi:hypothetical protein
MGDDKKKIKLELEEKYMDDILKVVDDYPEKLDLEDALIHLIDRGFTSKLRDLADAHNMRLVEN